MSDENWYDTASGEIVVINDSEIAEAEIVESLGNQYPALSGNTTGSQAKKLMTAWMQNIQRRKGGIFERDSYLAPRKIFHQFDVAEKAMESDDVVSGVYEATEALAFSQMHFECEDEDEQDIWDQIYEDLDIDARMREMWHDLFIYSNIYYGVIWGAKDYKIGGKTEKGNAKRRTVTGINVPLGITMIDPRKVIPAGQFMFNKESLVYIASAAETESFDAILAGGGSGMGDGLSVEDPIVQQMIVKEVPLSFVGSRNYLSELGYEQSNLKKLYLLNPQNVFRHTLTRPQYKSVANVRLRSIFDLLDLKHQLKEMDRASLLGATNWILLIKKGSDAMPGTRNEIAELSRYVQMSARVPVIVGDQRLNIEIITPKVDHTLDHDKYDLVDTRIAQRLFQMFVNPGGKRTEDSMKLARVIASGMENKREMLKRSLVKNLFRPAVKLNPDTFSDTPNLVFNPRHIALDFDQNLATFLLDLRDRGELSRETLLAEFNYDQSEEAWKRKIEKKKYDNTFETTVPFSGPGAATPGAPAATDPKAAGRTQGGNKNGGGAAKPSPKRGKTTDQSA